jgi:predicted adenylyl cyclase CyaB
MKLLAKVSVWDSMEINHFNIEIKARCRNSNRIRKILRQKKAEFIGVDHQIDTYFSLPPSKGRLKLREGDIENRLIFYKRSDRAGPKRSDVFLVDNPGQGMKEMLTKVVGVKTVVDKRREIYFIKNVKFHLDQVRGLGEFVEIEAISKSRKNGNGNGNGNIGKEILLKQVKEYMGLFEVGKEDLVPESYSDMLAKKG